MLIELLFNLNALAVDDRPEFASSTIAHARFES
jgi:hypothetical protein